MPNKAFNDAGKGPIRQSLTALVTTCNKPVRMDKILKKPVFNPNFM